MIYQNSILIPLLFSVWCLEECSIDVAIPLQQSTMQSTPPTHTHTLTCNWIHLYIQFLLLICHFVGLKRGLTLKMHVLYCSIKISVLFNHYFACFDFTSGFVLH